MTPVSARRLVLVSLLGLLALAAYRGSLTSGDLAKRLWGVGMLGLMLTVAADFAPTVAGPFALLVLVGYASAGGDAAIENVLGKISGSSIGTAGQTVATSAASGQVPSAQSPGTNP